MHQYTETAENCVFGGLLPVPDAAKPHHEGKRLNVRAKADLATTFPDPVQSDLQPRPFLVAAMIFAMVATVCLVSYLACRQSLKVSVRNLMAT